MTKIRKGTGIMGQKYYAVRVGREPGIYRSWYDCEAQVSGFRGARFKGFRTQHAAEVFMKGGNDKPRHKIGHAAPKDPERPTTPRRPRSPGRRSVSHEETGRQAPRSLYSGTRPPWEYPTFIACIEEN